MVKIKCPKCGEEDEINFNVKGWNLQGMRILFMCKKCDYPGVLTIKFTGGECEKEKVVWDDTSYIG